MTVIVDRLKFLGLNDREVRVFTALATFGRMNMTKTASRSGLPRTTVDAIVRRLVSQGLVSKEKVRGHYEYFINSDEVANTLDWIEKRFRPHTGAFFDPEDTDLSEQAGKEENIDEKNVIVKENTEELKQYAEKYKGDRIKLLFSRGRENMDACVQRFVRYLKIAFTNEYKLEVSLSASIADALTEHPEVPVPPRGEMVRLNVVPTVYSDSVNDMFIFRDSIYLIHNDTGDELIVVQPSVVEMSRHLMDIACETGWSVDFKTWMNKDQ